MMDCKFLEKIIAFYNIHYFTCWHAKTLKFLKYNNNTFRVFIHLTKIHRKMPMLLCNCNKKLKKINLLHQKSFLLYVIWGENVAYQGGSVQNKTKQKIQGVNRLENQGGNRYPQHGRKGTIFFWKSTIIIRYTTYLDKRPSCLAMIASVCWWLALTSSSFNAVTRDIPSVSNAFKPASNVFYTCVERCIKI